MLHGPAFVARLAIGCQLGNIRRPMSNIPALMDLLFPAARQRALAALLLRPEASLYLRELARMTGSHTGTLVRELD